MNIEGKTYLFWTKCVEEFNVSSQKYIYNYSLKIPQPFNYTIEELFAADCTVYENKPAVEKYNKIVPQFPVPEDIDFELYQILLFETVPVVTTDKDHPSKGYYLILSIDNGLFDKHVTNNSLPNKDYFFEVCKTHLRYDNIKNEFTTVNDVEKNIAAIAKESTSDPTDKIIQNPEFINKTMPLFNYQKRTVYWMVDKEIQSKRMALCNNNDIQIGSNICSVLKKTFMNAKSQKYLNISGGLLADEVGLGKTYQTIVASLLNQPTHIELFNPVTKYLKSRATLVICPNQLCGQWVREFNKVINPDYKLRIIQLMTKNHFDKITYMDLIDADFIILSYNFLANDAYYAEWVVSPTKQKAGTYVKSDSFYVEDAQKLFNEKAVLISSDPSKLFDKKPILNIIEYHRIICDEFHEIFTVDKYVHMKKLLPLFKGTNKWCITGTPFDKKNCLLNMVEFISGYSEYLSERTLTIDSVNKYLHTNFLRRNTKQSVKSEYSLEPFEEKIVRLKFSKTELMIYGSYKANSNIDKFSKLLRQLCCDPRIADELKTSLAQCTTPEEIEQKMVGIHKNAMDKASYKLRYIDYRIQKIMRHIKVVQFKRYRRFLKQLGYRVRIDYPSKIVNEEFDSQPPVDNKENETENKDKENNEENLDIEEPIEVDEIEDQDKDLNDNDKPLITVNDQTITTVHSKTEKFLFEHPSITLQNLEVHLSTTQSKRAQAKKDLDGKTGTYEFFYNMLHKIKKAIGRKDNKNSKDEEEDEEEYDEEEEEEEEEVCSICLGDLTGEDVGVTPCGHVFCYACLFEMVKSSPKCPLCTKQVKVKDIQAISYERPKLDESATKEMKDKMALVAKVGTKLANLIFYILSLPKDEKLIVFSQWDDMLKNIGDTLDTYGIKNVFCRGNVWMRDKAIREFSNNKDIQVIMLSSESAASGTNLTAASTVIIFEPVYGSYEYRRNTLWQAIGRAYRMGQTKKVKVIHFIINGTVEEEIYNMNIEEDKKFKEDLKLTEFEDDLINLDESKIEEISKIAELKEKEKATKKKPKIKGVEKEVMALNNVDNDWEINENQQHDFILEDDENVEDVDD